MKLRFPGYRTGCFPRLSSISRSVVSSSPTSSPPLVSSGFFPMTFSNCDQRDSTDSNSLPTCYSVSCSSSTCCRAAAEEAENGMARTAMTPSRDLFKRFIFMRTCSSDNAISETSWSLCSDRVSLLASLPLLVGVSEVYVQRKTFPALQ